MAKLISSHLNEDKIIEAIMDEGGLDGATRDHLFECSACRSEKRILEGKLSRFGQVFREQAPMPLRRPHLPRTVSLVFRPAWKSPFSIGLGLAVASLLALLLNPLVFKHGKDVNLAKIYQEMVQDDKFMTEIESLEENPLPRFYVDISDPSDQDGPDDDSTVPGRAG